MTFPELLDEGLEPHAVKELWVVGTPTPDHFIDISTTVETKVNALLAHASQVDADRIRQMIPERAKTLGESHGLPYAEAYRRIQIP